PLHPFPTRRSSDLISLQDQDRRCAPDACGGGGAAASAGHPRLHTRVSPLTTHKSDVTSHHVASDQSTRARQRARGAPVGLENQRTTTARQPSHGHEPHQPEPQPHAPPATPPRTAGPASGGHHGGAPTAPAPHPDLMSHHLMPHHLTSRQPEHADTVSPCTRSSSATTTSEIF